VLNGFWEVSEHIVVHFRKSADGAWTAVYYPRSGTWFWGDRGPMEPRNLEVSDGPEPQLPECVKDNVGRSGAVAPLGVPGSSYWGTTEIKMYGGSPLISDSELEWLYLDDAAAWDATASGRCPVAAGVQKLLGQKESEVHGIFGFKYCENHAFVRLSPESADLNASGWSAVAGYHWKFGTDIFLRRMLASRGWRVGNDQDFSDYVQDLVRPGTPPDFDSVRRTLATAAWVEK